MFSPPALVPLVLSEFLVEHVTGQFRLLILVVPCWMEAPLLSTVLGMLKDIPDQCAIIRNVIMNVSVAWLLKGLQITVFNPFLIRDVCCTDKGSLPQSVIQWWGDSSIYNNSSPVMLERMGKLELLRGCPKQCHI